MLTSVILDGWNFFSEGSLELKMNEDLKEKNGIDGELYLVAAKYKDNDSYQIFKDFKWNRFLLLANDEFMLAYENGHLSELMLFADKLGEEISWTDAKNPEKTIFLVPKVYNSTLE